MKRLLLTFYGDDLTGSTDALEQLERFGIHAMLFIKPPTRAQLKRYHGLQAVGVAGMTRSMTPNAMERELKPALKQLKALGAPHVHYKVCSTFDSSPGIGSIGRVIDVASEIFRAPFVPLVVGAPPLGRYCIFGNLFARFGIGSNGGIFRLDRHPAISAHPITPMTEADLRLHLAKQTKKTIALFDILKIALPQASARAALKNMLAEKPGIVLFDVLEAEQLPRIAELIDAFASREWPLFSVGSSAIEMALGAHWKEVGTARCGVRLAGRACPARQILVASGSCSPVTEGQIAWALENGFAEVTLDIADLLFRKASQLEIQRATKTAVKCLRAGRNVIIHTGKRKSQARHAAMAKLLGTSLGEVLHGALAQTMVQRVCIAGGDTSSHAARALGIEALEMLAPLTPGAPLCRAHAPGSPADGREVVFKGGQVGAENYFAVVLKGGTKWV
jgi:uncharacterized protein YgbK (DUF1537 family)